MKRRERSQTLKT